MTLREWRDVNPLRLWRLAPERPGQTTLRAVALLAGVSITAVWLWERGERRPKPDHVAAIAHMMDIRFHQLAEAWQWWIDQEPEN